jgi:ADP-ribose pyrophosphatase YjhB (NUDIX family)
VSAKGPAAVVVVTRGDLVLGLTRGRLDDPSKPITVLTDLHLPGGKEADEDKADEGWAELGLAITAARELAEETRLRVRPEDLRHVLDLVQANGRPISAYAMEAPDGAPLRFEATDAGQPTWVPPAALVQPWCTFRVVCGAVLAAAGVAAPLPSTAPALCPDCTRWLVCAVEPAGLRLPIHRSHPEDPRSTTLCGHSLAVLGPDGRSREDDATAAGLLELAEDALAGAQVARATIELRARRA